MLTRCKNLDSWKWKLHYPFPFPSPLNAPRVTYHLSDFSACSRGPRNYMYIHVRTSTLPSATCPLFILQ